MKYNIEALKLMILDGKMKKLGAYPFFLAAVAVMYSQGAFAGLRTPLQLPPNAVADYQLGGSYTPPADVNVVVRDSTASPVKGLYNICYVNGFQTQPCVQWPENLLVSDTDGKPLVDPSWPDEFLLDISSDATRSRILDRIKGTISICAKAGFDAVEFDNLDSYTRSQGALTVKHAITFARQLVQAAHDLSLAAGQKNAPDLSKIGGDQIGFDFAISEECHRFQECAAYTKIYGDRVINIEYAEHLRGSFEDVCGDPQTPKNTLMRDLKLVPLGEKQYVYKHC